MPIRILGGDKGRQVLVRSQYKDVACKQRHINLLVICCLAYLGLDRIIDFQDIRLIRLVDMTLDKLLEFLFLAWQGTNDHPLIMGFILAIGRIVYKIVKILWLHEPYLSFYLEKQL